MQRDYLLDTNAYFNILKSTKLSSDDTPIPQLETLKMGTVYISTITKIEIISVLGKYARGQTGGFQKCNCIISEDNKICENSKYTKPRKRWNTKTIKGWLKLVSETIDGTSNIIKLTILPFDNSTIVTAQEIIQYSLQNSFASMDALIAATAKNEIDKHHDLVVVTSDKGLKACLSKCGIPYLDLFT